MVASGSPDTEDEVHIVYVTFHVSSAFLWLWNQNQQQD